MLRHKYILLQVYVVKFYVCFYGIKFTLGIDIFFDIHVHTVYSFHLHKNENIYINKLHRNVVYSRM